MALASDHEPPPAPRNLQRGSAHFAPDLTSVRELFVLGIMDGRKFYPSTQCSDPHFDYPAKAVPQAALRSQLPTPRAYLSYALFGTGLSLALIGRSTRREVLGSLLSFAAAAWFFAYRYILHHFFPDYLEASLRDDLADIAAHYKVQDMLPDGSGELVTPTPSGFWAVETESAKGTGQEIVGFVGLGVDNCFEIYS